MPTLVLSPRYTDDSQVLWRAARHAGWSVERLPSHNPPDWLRNQQIALYGEGLFVRIVAERLGLAILEPTFDWLTSLPAVHCKRKIQYTTLAQARSYQIPAFIKPAGDKTFAANVYENGAALPVDQVLDDLPVLVSESVHWDVEYRCFVLGKEPLTTCAYKGSIAAPDQAAQALSYCREVLASSDAPPAFVMDVGIIQDKGWAVIEANNPAWASGVYDCDPVKVLEVLQRACIRPEALSNEDKRWVVA